jgi:electron transfer flavoprotein beta subunit
MAPASTLPVLREALAMGADRAVLLSDQWFAGSDTLATSRILAAAIRRLAPFDLICCGNSTLDGSTAQVPSQVAEFLQVPNIMHVSRMELEPAGKLVVTQKIEHGSVKFAAAPPLLLSFTKEANKPRYSSFLEILAAEDREIAIWSNADLQLGAGLIGLGGSPTQMADLLVRQKVRQGLHLTGSPEEIARQLADKISQMGII